MKERLEILTAIVLFIALASTPVYSELTEEDLSEIQKVVKEEISVSEQRTTMKLAEINTEIKVIKTDIKGAKDRLSDTHTLVIAVITLIGVIIIIATAMTYAATKFGSLMPQIDKLLKSNDEIFTSFGELRTLLAQYTEVTNERKKINEDLAALLAKMEGTLAERNNQTPHVPAD